jgi:hypothetical protein
MVMRYAVVKNNKVINVIVADQQFIEAHDGEFVLTDDGSAEIGFERREGKWGNPEAQDFIDGEWRNREPEEAVEHNPPDEGEPSDS